MKKPFIAVLLGSESDLAVMSRAVETLDSLGISSRTAIASAHRTPELLRATVAKFEKDGALAYIAGAGMAAHLPGVVASLTIKPVIGVPISSKLLGLDSLLSIVQMPSGIPVATVAIDGAANAALLAAQILAVSDAKLAAKLASLRRETAARTSPAKSKLYGGQ
ncbi:MAG: 5-(carboxyamino)imidazole ribonucleotide mutase [Elusimicrobiales bacterium]|nr:5-(carboxyamino)imidazole ribonucleotide mutase [Elusimicrobiales bacterium]